MIVLIQQNTHGCIFFSIFLRRCTGLFLPRNSTSKFSSPKFPTCIIEWGGGIAFQIAHPGLVFLGWILSCWRFVDLKRLVYHWHWGVADVRFVCRKSANTSKTADVYVFFFRILSQLTIQDSSYPTAFFWQSSRSYSVTATCSMHILPSHYCSLWLSECICWQTFFAILSRHFNTSTHSRGLNFVSFCVFKNCPIKFCLVYISTMPGGCALHSSGLGIQHIFFALPIGLGGGHRVWIYLLISMI